MSTRLRAATLAVGTEVTDGQITDRNSGWISQRCTSAGIEMIEHRVVPDDREIIARSLGQLCEKADLLFVTGGLGPTSDDFTRDLISDVFKSPLEFNEPSWQKIVKRFESRGAVAKAIQRQQCFFPRGATILENPAGTANAFSMSVISNDRSVFVVVLPGPPAEIAAVWEMHLANKIEALVPPEDHEDLVVWQTLGLGEGDIAEKVEEAVTGSGLRVGYRVHLPYVEVKIWVRRTEAAKAQPFLNFVDHSIGKWTVARDKSDPADCIIKASFKGRNIAIIDRVTAGFIQARLFERLNDFRKTHPGLVARGSLQITTSLLTSGDASKTELAPPGEGDSLFLSLTPDLDKKQWLIKMTGLESQSLALEPTPLYNFDSERGQRYATEKMFHLVAGLQSFSPLKDSGKD